MAEEYMPNWSHFSGRRQRVHAAMELLFDYEKSLGSHLVEGLETIDGVTIHGITAPDAMDRRVPTVSLTHDDLSPDEIAIAMAERNIFVWSGDFYAVELLNQLGVDDPAAVLRIGPVHYNSTAEIDETLQVLKTIVDR